MLEDKIKQGQLIADLVAAKDEPGMRHLVVVLDNLISQLREENDTVEGTLLYRNQGGIRGFNRLKGYIQRGLPTNAFEEKA